MIFRTLKAEQLKLKRSPVWLAFLIMPIVPAFMGTFNYVQNIDILQNEWYSLWTQHTLFTCYFFLPTLIGIYCSYLFRLEHLNHNWNSVLTAPVSVWCIYTSKLISASFMSVLTQVWIGVLFVLSGKMIGLTAPIPSRLILWLVYGAIGSFVICALQLCISLVIRSFAVPAGVSLIGGIAGLVALSKGYGIWFPYSLVSIGMCANTEEGMMAYSPNQFLISACIYVMVFIIFGVLWMKNRDVVVG